MGSSKPFFFLESIWFLCLFLRSTEAQTAAAHQSIFTLDAFSFQQSCVQNCFTMGFANINCYTDMLGSAIGCPNSPCSKTWAAVDDCYCRGDLQPAAHDWLSSCIGELCTVGDNTVNLDNAASIYSGYCTDRGFTALPVQNVAETSSKKTNSASTATTANSQPGETSTSNSDSSSQGPSTASSSTNKTLTIALGVACALFVIISIVAGFLFWKIRRDKKKLWLGLLKNESEVHQDESASQVNQPSVMMGPSYPHYPVPPSALSSNRAYQSTIGPQQYFPRR